RELNIAFPVDQLTAHTRLAQLPDLLLAQLENGDAPPPQEKPADVAPAAEAGAGFLRIVTRAQVAAELAEIHFDAAALTSLPDGPDPLGDRLWSGNRGAAKRRRQAVPAHHRPCDDHRGSHSQSAAHDRARGPLPGGRTLRCPGPGLDWPVVPALAAGGAAAP